MLQGSQLTTTLADFWEAISVSLIGCSVATGSAVIRDSVHNWLNSCGVPYGITSGFTKKVDKDEKKRGKNAPTPVLTMREIRPEWKRLAVCKAHNIFFCMRSDLKGTYACPEPAVEVIVQI